MFVVASLSALLSIYEAYANWSFYVMLKNKIKCFQAIYSLAIFSDVSLKQIK